MDLSRSIASANASPTPPPSPFRGTFVKPEIDERRSLESNAVREEGSAEEEERERLEQAADSEAVTLPW